MHLEVECLHDEREGDGTTDVDASPINLHSYVHLACDDCLRVQSRRGLNTGYFKREALTEGNASNQQRENRGFSHFLYLSSSKSYDASSAQVPLSVTPLIR